MDEFYAILADLFGGEISLLENTVENYQELEKTIGIQSSLYGKIIDAIRTIPITVDTDNVLSVSSNPQVQLVLNWTIEASNVRANIKTDQSGKIYVDSKIPVISHVRVRTH